MIKNNKICIESVNTKKPGRAAKLGDILQGFLENYIDPQQRKIEPLLRVWNNLLPTQLGSHCRIVDLSGRQLSVAVDSAAYRQELSWCSQEIIRQLEKLCPAAKVKKIKIIIG